MIHLRPASVADVTDIGARWRRQLRGRPAPGNPLACSPCVCVALAASRSLLAGSRRADVGGCVQPAAGSCRAAARQTGWPARQPAGQPATPAELSRARQGEERQEERPDQARAGGAKSSRLAGCTLG